jgi:hypothetical protein
MGRGHDEGVAGYHYISTNVHPAIPSDIYALANTASCSNHDLTATPIGVEITVAPHDNTVAQDDAELFVTSGIQQYTLFQPNPHPYL